MTTENFQPLLAISRGLAGKKNDIVESIHYGAIAVVNVNAELIASYGDPYTITYMRSTAKPFQALPFIERGGKTAFNLSSREIALICASHSGTDEHVETVRSIQAKAGFLETDLMCGVHPPIHEATALALQQRGEKPSPNRHNCSGKHSGMLAFAKMENLPLANYIDPAHPIQEILLSTFAEMCKLSLDQVHLGTDGCSAPNFAVPLYNAALAYARLCGPITGGVAPPERANACLEIFRAMTSYPEMIGGPGRFDTQLMQVTQGRIISKEGAEGYLGFGLKPGAIAPNSPAVGVAIKISDGDLRNRAIPPVGLETLRQLGVLNPNDLAALSNFGPVTPVLNWRKLIVGYSRPIFTLLQNQ